MHYTKRLCKQCQKPTANPKFCSRSCAITYNNKKSPKRKPEHRCSKCKKPITAHHKYCADCTPFRYDWSTTTIQDIQDRAKYQVSAYIRQKARIAHRESNLPKCCAVCGYDKHYEVCHRKAIADFDPNTLVSDVNQLSNLVALCPNHHWEYDNGLLQLP